jgi:hypothetical protein
MVCRKLGSKEAAKTQSSRYKSEDDSKQFQVTLEIFFKV